MQIDSKYIMREIAGEKVVVRQGTHGVDMTRIISFNERLQPKMQGIGSAGWLIVVQLLNKYNYVFIQDYLIV